MSESACEEEGFKFNSRCFGQEWNNLQNQCIQWWNLYKQSLSVRTEKQLFELS